MTNKFISPTTFLTCFRDERLKYSGKKVRLNRVSTRSPRSHPGGAPLLYRLPIDSKPFPTQTLVFTYMQYKSFENSVEKGEIARNEQFLLFQQCFLSIFITFKIIFCKLFRFRGAFDVWERLNTL